MAQVVIQKGGAAGGRMECDGKKHRYVYAEYKEYGLPETMPMGKCPDPETCKQKAAFLIQQEKEQAEMLAKVAAAAAQVRQQGHQQAAKQQAPTPTPTQQTPSPAAAPAAAFSTVTKG